MTISLKFLQNAPILIVASSAIFLTFKMRFINLGGFAKSLRSIRESGKKESFGTGSGFKISALKAFFIQASATLGIGNISGSLFALYFGGPGSAFWIIVVTIFLSIVKFCEILIGFLYKETDQNGQCYSGIFYVFKHAFVGTRLKKIAPLIGIGYAATLAFNVTCWSGFQLNQSIGVLKMFLTDNTGDLADGHLRFSVIVSIAILYGVYYFSSSDTKILTNVLSIAVPAMVLGYAMLIFWSIFGNISKTASIFKIIMQDAFNFKSAAAGGFVAISVAIQRSVLATEAGIGTAAIPYANSNLENATKNAFLSFFDALVVAFVMSSGIVAIMHLGLDVKSAQNLGIHSMGNAFQNFSPLAGLLFTSVVVAFGLTTLLGNSFYVKATMLFFNKKFNPRLFAIIHVVPVFFISLNKGIVLIKLIDSLNYLLIIPDVLAVLLLSSIVKKLAFDKEPAGK